MTIPSSGILDNKSLGSVVSELRKNIDAGCRLSIVSAFFSLYAYEDLKKELSKIENLRLLLPVTNDMAPFFANLAGSHLDRRFRNRLDITRIARDCAAWLEKKCEVRQVASPIHQNLFHIDNFRKEGQQVAIVGSSPFTIDGLGVVPSESHHMNTCFHDNEQAHGLLKWFDDLWRAGRENRDVKERLHQALAVIKYYELRNDRVLVLCSKKLRENWTLYTINDKRNIMVADRFNYDVLNHTDLTRVRGMSGAINLKTLNWGNYDLVVIDESHNFRNNPARKDETLTRYARLMNDIIRAGVKTKILILSATPVNNRMNDLKNQVAFIAEGDDTALKSHGITSIEHTLKMAQTRFNAWLKLGENQRTTESLLDTLNFGYFKLLDLLTIARSRKHIEKYYEPRNT